MAGFIWGYNLSGGRPLIFEFVMKDTETLTAGDLLNVETGEVDLAATNDTALLGPMTGPADPDDNVSGQPGRVAGTDSTTKVKAVVNSDAVLVVQDANARVAGATLDLAGATGAQTVAASSNVDFRCVRDASASEDTVLMIAPGEHFLD